MTDANYPSSKPTVNGGAAINPSIVPPPAAAAKPQMRHPYRPQPQYHNNRRRHRSRRNICCCCCFWSILIIVALCLLAAIAGAALYVLYHPRRPQFSISSLRVSKFNLTTSSDSSSSHLHSSLNLTLSSLNPNAHVSFFYNPFSISCFSDENVFIANSTIPAFNSRTKNETVFRVVLAGSGDLDSQSATSLRSDLKKKKGVPLKIQMDTKVKVKIGKMKSEKVGIRVTCQGIKAVAPKGKSPSEASVSDSKCTVDIRIKIWKFTF